MMQALVNELIQKCKENHINMVVMISNLKGDEIAYGCNGSFIAVAGLTKAIGMFDDVKMVKDIKVSLNKKEEANEPK